MSDNTTPDAQSSDNADQSAGTTPDVATAPSEGAVNTADGAIEPGSGLAQFESSDNPAGRAPGLAPDGSDPSNTYEYGVVGNVNLAAPVDAHMVTDPDEAQDAGYFGYAPGENATEGYTLAEAGARNERLREARRAVVNRSAEDEDGHTADRGTRNRGRGRGRGRGNA
jgi:hypothetical protein